jgi:hypothetical protein
MAQDAPPDDFGTPRGSDSPMSNAGAESAVGVGPEVCPHCGASKNAKSTSNNLDLFLGRLGMSDDMIESLKSSMRNVDVEQYLDTARDYLKSSGDKAKSFAKENPGKVAAGVAVLAVGTGLLISALNRE